MRIGRIAMANDADGPAAPIRTERDGAASTDPWGRLMAAAQAGDRQAYATLLREVAPFARRIAGRYLGPTDAEDAVQEILITLHAVRHTYDPARPFRPWLATLASRRIIDLLRRRGRRHAPEVELGDEIEALVGGDDGPAALAARVVDIRELRAAVAELPRRQREAVELLRLREMTLEEAARASGQTTGSLKVALHRAMRSLRGLLEGRG